MSKERPHIEDSQGRIENPNVAKEIADIENKGHDESKSRLVRKVKEFFPPGRKKIREAEGRAEARGGQIEKQYAIGEEVYEALQVVADRNKEFNIHRGKVDEKEGPMRVLRIKDNKGLGYSVIVKVESKTSTQGEWPVVQINVNLTKTGKEVHVFEGPYGPYKDYDIDNYRSAISEASRIVSNWRLYKE